MTMLMERERTWIDVCSYDGLETERGVRALVGDAHVALFRTNDGHVYAVDAIDPFSGASVLARGIVGSRGADPFVASPLFKQRFDLRTGICLDDPTIAVQVFPIEVDGGRVRVGSP